MQKLNTLYRFFISDKLIDDPLVHRKAKVFINVLFFSISIGFVLQILSFSFIPNNPVPFYPSLLAAICLLFLYKKSGNTILVSNLLALSWAVPLAISIPATRGIYSDNLLWLFICPLIVLLFANRNYGIIVNR